MRKRITDWNRTINLHPISKSNEYTNRYHNKKSGKSR